MLPVRRGPIVCVCRNVPAEMKNMNFPLRGSRTSIGGERQPSGEQRCIVSTCGSVVGRFTCREGEVSVSLHHSPRPPSPRCFVALEAAAGSICCAQDAPWTHRSHSANNFNTSSSPHKRDMFTSSLAATSSVVSVCGQTGPVEQHCLMQAGAPQGQGT